MDRLIKRFEAGQDRDLMICAHRGVAYQADMRSGRVSYDEGYFAHYQGLQGSDVELALNAGRCAMVGRHAEPGLRLLDVGIGNGSFVVAAGACGFEARGYDINPAAVCWLRSQSLYADDIREFDALTMWDSLEHMEAPERILKRVKRGGLVCVAIPVVKSVFRVRDSKHYKPGEHLYYWTEDGFVEWMGMHGFRLLERSSHETDAGRDSIAAFAFRRDLPDYHDHIAAYTEIHASKHYGNSATELHLQAAAGIVRRRHPKSILDYGCGRSDLAAHFWRDGERKIARYDPAIPKLKDMPEGRFDLGLCCDVMEHVPIASVDRVLEELHEKCAGVFFTISLKLARARLPDGRNAHVTLLRRGEWLAWIKDYFGAARELPSALEHELLVAAGGAV